MSSAEEDGEAGGEERGERLALEPSPSTSSVSPNPVTEEGSEPKKVVISIRGWFCSLVETQLEIHPSPGSKAGSDSGLVLRASETEEDTSRDQIASDRS